MSQIPKKAVGQKQTLRVFYSWQSDLPERANAQLIRSALLETATTLAEDENQSIKLICDEATRDVPGSPDIVDSIFEKIQRADVFVCDISKVHETLTPDGEVRKFCNPNVAIELGYAVRELGWSRVILL